MGMTVSDMARDFGFEIVAGKDGCNNEIIGVYLGDLLSWVMGRSKEGDCWITIQGHINIIAVALLTGAACIVIAEGAEVDPDTLAKADAEDIPILRTSLTGYEIAKKFAAVL